jgi:membrane protein implicated in regulation of membrane protease activity
MDTFYLLCALVGGTILVCQFVMTVLGLSGDAGDASGDVAADAGGIDGGAIDVPDHATGHHRHTTEWFFKVISFQTVVAAFAFFGLAGKAGTAADLPPMTTLIVAVAAGLAAMYGVYFLLRAMHKFNSDGTVRIQRALGRPGTVYVPVPGAKAGAGKVYVNIQNREMEYLAMTPHERLPTGAKVVVTGVLGPDTVEVEPIREVETTAHA